MRKPRLLCKDITAGVGYYDQNSIARNSIGSAAIEGIVADIGEGGGHIDVRQAGAMGEGIVTDAGDQRGYGDLGEGGAAVEAVVGDSGEALGERYAFKGRTVCESVVADAVHIVRQLKRA